MESNGERGKARQGKGRSLPLSFVSLRSFVLLRAQAISFSLTLSAGPIFLDCSVTLCSHFRPFVVSSGQCGALAAAAPHRFV